MNNFHILHGTRMGRKVNQVDEVLAEFKNYKPETETPAMLPPEAGLPVASPANPIPTIDSRIERLPNGHFRFYQVSYQGGVLDCIERPMQYLDGGAQKTQQGHLDWLAEPANNMTEYTLADMELEFQMARISFTLRDDSQFGTAARQYIEQIRTLYDSWIVTADHIEYQSCGLEAVIINKGKIPSKPQKQVIIPTYTGNHSVLSSERQN